MLQDYIAPQLLTGDHVNVGSSHLVPGQGAPAVAAEEVAHRPHWHVPASTEHRKVIMGQANQVTRLELSLLGCLLRTYHMELL